MSEFTSHETMVENLTDMLADRGDDVSEFSEHVYLTPSHMFKTHQLIFHTDRTAVFFVPKTTLSGTVKTSLFKSFKEAKETQDPEKLQEFFSQSEDPEHVQRNVRSAIFVLDEDPQSHNRKIIAEADRIMQGAGGMVQHFTYNELMYNPTKHIYVPPHKKMMEHEAKTLMETYQIRSKSQLPAILRTDMMARWLGLKHGDIVQITRNNPSSGVYYYYRCCV